MKIDIISYVALVTHSHASLTKIERQEIILSIEYPISFIAVSVDKLQNQESCMHNGWSIYNSNLFSFSFISIYKTIGWLRAFTCFVLCLSFMYTFIIFFKCISYFW